jgi:hypothetical protein
MKKALWYTIGFLFLLSTLAFAVDRPASAVKVEPVKQNFVKTAKMHATGKVVDITDESLIIERTVKGDIEKMEFALEKPAIGITVNDYVKIEYAEKDGKLAASRVSKVNLKKKEVKPVEVKPAPVKK